ncbi:pitrilysin family protein [Acidisphaera sp. L21]|uniref:M16 family metallopeptidase n=1 Tax=Acidisphaera sp. L21 TaxID=1641851 RepID=UPI0020B11532|nr:pitrilysin family protein [Acidisphaera sp. L21]
MMRHVLALPIAIVLSALSFPTHAQAPTGAAPTGQAGLSGSVPEGVVRATLPNGMQIVVVPDHLAPVVSTALNYMAGSNDAPPGFPGTAHALEHMMFRGADGLDRDQLAELGALLGGAYNANTSETVTQYTYTVTARDLGVALRSEALRMRGLTLAKDDWDRERGAIEQEVSRDLSSPFYNYAAQARAILFAGTPYENDALGSRPTFDKTDTAMLRTFYERWYAPNNAILVIAGDVDPPKALAEATAIFGDIPRRDIPAHPGFTLNPVQPQTLELPTNFPFGLVTLAFRMPGLRAQDFAAADILGDVLGSQRAALYGLVPDGKALLAQFSFQAKPDVGLGLAVAAFPTGGDPAPLLADLHRVLADAAENGVSPELVEASKRQELAQLAFENDSISGLARIWSRALTSQGANSPEDIAKAYAAVTLADVNRLAKALLDPSQMITGILTPDTKGRPPTSGGFGGAESFANPPDHPVTLPAWAAAAMAKLPDPYPVASPVVTILPNGLRLIVQPEHVSHTISVYGQVRGEESLQQPAGQDGIAQLLGRLFNDGTETHDRLAFRKAIDDIGAVESAGASFSLKVLTPQFEPGMKLLAENQLHPAFPADAFAISRRQLAQNLTGLLGSPSYLYQRAIRKSLVPDGDPSLRQPTPDGVAALSPAELRAYYDATIRPDLTTIVVIGDVTPEDALRVVTANFGDWKSAGKTPVVDLPPVAPNKLSSSRVADPSSLQDRVALSQTLLLPVFNLDRYKLELGNLILGSGFSSRLLQDLRVKTGYVYSASSALHWDRTRSFYTISFGADAANVEKARVLVLRDLTDMQTTDVTDAELNRAKAQILRELPMQRASVGSIAALYLRRVDLGLELNTDAIAAQHYRDITADDIRQVFAAWIRPDALAEVVQGPPLPN